MASRLNGIGGRMAYLKTRKATTRTRTAWMNLPRAPAIEGLALRGGCRRRAAPALEGHEEAHQIDVLPGREHLAEGLRHHAGREAGHGALGLGIEDLAHDVVDRLRRPDVREVGPHRAGADAPRLVAGDARALAREDGLAGL